MDMGVLPAMADKPVVYLAGAIRDGVADDIAWRERAIGRLQDVARILNPLAGKSYNADTGKWLLYGNESPDAKYIVHADFWCVDRADIILFNFASLADKYPSLGTLTEFGRSTSRSILRLAIVGKGYEGHVSQRHFPGLHPFLAENCAKVFNRVEEALSFTRSYCLAVTEVPRFRGSTMVDARTREEAYFQRDREADVDRKATFWNPLGLTDLEIREAKDPPVIRKWADPTWPDPKWRTTSLHAERLGG